MSNRALHRSARARVARETLEACERGSYVAPSGAVVSLREPLARAVAATVCADAAPAPAAPRGETVVEVVNETTLAAVEALAAARAGGLGCLNFASAKNPGGGFLGGAEAQEESLARSSGLYPCLLTQQDAFYAPNRANRSTLYLDRVVVSPFVPFFRRDDGAWLEAPHLATVLTAPAPNLGALRQHRSPEVALVPETLRRRGALVLGLAAAHGVRRLVLGAWGCGVFRNDPAEVAATFARLLRGAYAGAFERVVFGVYDRSRDKATLHAFERAFAA